MAQLKISKSSAVFLGGLIIAMGIFSAMSGSFSELTIENNDNSRSLNADTSDSRVQRGFGSSVGVIKDTWEKSVGKVDYEIPYVDEITNKFDGLTGGAERVKNGLTQIGDWSEDITTGIGKFQSAGSEVPLFNQFMNGLAVMLTIIVIRSFDISI